MLVVFVTVLVTVLSLVCGCYLCCQYVVSKVVAMWISVQAKSEDALDLCQLLNDDLAKTIAKHPRRFVGLGTLPMQVKSSVGYFEGGSQSIIYTLTY